MYVLNVFLFVITWVNYQLCCLDPVYNHNHNKHGALCDVIYHALLQDNTGCRKEQRCAGSRLDHPGDVFHPDFMHGKPAYFDFTVRCPLLESLLGWSAVSAGVAAAKGEEDKDAHHDELVQAVGGVFVPLGFVVCC